MIAVVIAVRDQVDYLGEALDSVSNQTLQAAEVVVVDDESSDGSGALAAARGVRTLRIQHSGPKTARLAGARETTAPWLVFLDGDDRLRPRHHELLLGAAERAGDDGAYGMVREFADPDAPDAARYEVREDARLVPLTGACVVRRELFLDAMTSDPDGAGHDWFSGADRLSGSVTVGEVVLERRIHGRNRTIVSRAEVHAAYLAAARAAIVRRRGADT